MSCNAIDIILKVLPVIVLILLGYALQRFKFFRSNTIQDFKKFVVTIPLPSLLYLAFASLKLKTELLLVVLVVFAVCLFMIFAGKYIARALGIKTPYFVMLMGGYEAGMLGYSLFISGFGQDNISKFAVVDLGQVLFVFFVLVTLLIKIRDGISSASDTFKRFITSPVIIAILLGLVTSLVKMAGFAPQGQGVQFIKHMLQTLGSLTVPLICIVIGYELKINLRRVRLSFITIGIRLAVLIVIALLISEVFFERVLGLEEIYKYALVTMFILPPPFVIPIYMKEEDKESTQYVVNTLSIHTVISVLLFMVILLIY